MLQIHIITSMCGIIIIIFLRFPTLLCSCKRKSPSHRAFILAYSRWHYLLILLDEIFNEVTLDNLT